MRDLQGQLLMRRFAAHRKMDVRNHPVTRVRRNASVFICVHLWFSSCETLPQRQRKH
jgi:hypothetical protein